MTADDEAMSDPSRPKSVEAPHAPTESAAAGEGFLSRWSRRKAQVAGGGASGAVPAKAFEAPVATGVAAGGEVIPSAARDAAAPAGVQVSGPAAGDEASAARPDASPAAPSTAPGGTAERRTLTIEDVERLDAQSDYRAFTSKDVDPEVRNAAMRKLFHSDPHFNVMDGLDVYIDDYNTPQPLSRAIMRTMLQARVLGLIDDELQEQPLPPGEEASAAASASPSAASGVQDQVHEPSRDEAQHSVRVEPASADEHDPVDRTDPDLEADKPS